MGSTFGTQWEEGLRLVSFCPVCNTRYSAVEARMLGRQGETHLLHVRCRKCGNSILALVLVNQVGASSVGLVTDLGYEDVVRFRAAPKVTVDDVIDTHKLFDDPDWTKTLGDIEPRRLRKAARRGVRQRVIQPRT